MPFAILDPFSGISGDMTLGALVDVGLDADWLRALPARLGLEAVVVRVECVQRSGIACVKVNFDIPPQPHGRHLRQIRELLARAGMPETVRARADAAFTAIANAEGEIHNMPPERVHLHEVGAVDAILDIVGAVWGFEQLQLGTVYCGTIALGDGTVGAAHGVLPVPAPATLKLLEGHPVRPGPFDAGELVTPTGAALVRVLSSGAPPDCYVPVRSGFGAGTRDPHGRPNALRLVVAESLDAAGAGRGARTRVESLVQLSTDVDDMDGESLSAAANALRAEGALDVVLIPTLMKKGRPGARLDVLCAPADVARLEDAIFAQSSSIGLRRLPVERVALEREERTAHVLQQPVRVKIVTLASGVRHAKPEFEDIAHVAAATGRSLREVAALARAAAERIATESVSLPAG